MQCTMKKEGYLSSSTDNNRWFATNYDHAACFLRIVGRTYFQVRISANLSLLFFATPLISVSCDRCCVDSIQPDTHFTGMCCFSSSFWGNVYVRLSIVVRSFHSSLCVWSNVTIGYWYRVWFYVLHCFRRVHWIDFHFLSYLFSPFFVPTGRTIDCIVGRRVIDFLKISYRRAVSIHSFLLQNLSYF